MDAACGWGSSAQLLHALGPQAVGLILVQSMIETVRRFHSQITLMCRPTSPTPSTSSRLATSTALLPRNKYVF